MEFLRLAKMLALSLVCCLSMAACSKDSDDSGAKEPEDPDPYYMLETLDASFSVIANEDVAEIADVSCVVTDFKGESKNINLISAALLVIAFFFTNPATINKKYATDVKNDVAAIRAILEGRMAAVSPAPTGDGGFNVGQLVSLQQQ